MIEKYKEILNLDFIDNFFYKYLNVPSLLRLKNIGYFCGMDYASKDIYNFSEKLSRYDHSIYVALITWKCTKDKRATLAALFHDISTPCFSHAIDYMNKDYVNQESTEEYTRDILSKDELLIKYLKEDNILLEDVVNFKQYTIVDNNRPKLCADRLDGVVLTGLFLMKSLIIKDVKNIIDDIVVYVNEDEEKEIGFKSKDIALLVMNVNNSFDIFCNSKEDIYMMELLASITKIAINKNIIGYEDLYKLDESNLVNILKNCNDIELSILLKKFQNIKRCEIPDFEMPVIKNRKLNVLVDGVRLDYFMI